MPKRSSDPRKNSGSDELKHLEIFKENPGKTLAEISRRFTGVVRENIAG